MRQFSFVWWSALAVFAGACSGGGSAQTEAPGVDGSSGTGGSSSSGAASTGSSSSGAVSTGSSSGGATSSNGGSSGGSGGAGSSDAGGATSSDTGSPAVADAGGDGAAGGHRAADAACTTTDMCPAPNGGITFDCEKRFLLGENYAWQNWGYDFGGGATGVAGNSATVKAALQDMQSHGADVIRWWMFQELNGNNGVELANGIPTGNARGTLVADVQAALSLAAQVGVHYNFTLFSFDDFVFSAGRYDMAPIITSDANRAKLMQFVAFLAQTVESDPNRDRLVSWDVVNEPEWAIGGMDGDVDASVSTGMDPYGDQAFNGGTAGKLYDLVTFTQMETFVRDTVTALHQNSSAPVTVGSAAVKWKGAWEHVGLDYYTVHMYDWVNQYYPYTASVASYGFTLPVVLGEFPNQGLTGVPFATLLSGIFGKSVGYAGAMPWAYTDQSYPWSGANGGAANVQAFAASETCVTKF